MSSKAKIIDCYNKTSEEYAKSFNDELDHKPFDRMLLEKFAGENKRKLTADFGCGPGQTTRFLKDSGIENIMGIDISDAMVNKASALHEDIMFESGDMLKLKYPKHTFGAAVAFYSIVHFTYPQVKKAFEEVYRVLEKRGQFLFSFHLGKGKVHREEFLGQEVDVDFYFFRTEKIIALLNETGFKIITASERYPYEEEYPSKRAYILVMSNEQLAMSNEQ